MHIRCEIQLATSLQHPPTVPLLAAGDAGGLRYPTVPSVRDESLRRRLERESERPVSDAVLSVREVADAVAYAHRS